jgi:hypothetical protein
MDRPHRDSRQHNGITVRPLSQLTFATKSANNGPAETAAACQFGAIFKTPVNFVNAPIATFLLIE